VEAEIPDQFADFDSQRGCEINHTKDVYFGCGGRGCNNLRHAIAAELS
jgi:hypothetical protein